MQSAEYFSAKHEVDRIQQIVERLVASHAPAEEVDKAVVELSIAQQSFNKLVSEATTLQREMIAVELCS